MNKEKLKGYWEKVRETFGKISKKVKILIAAALVVLLVLIVALVVFFNTRPYATLVTGATDEELSSVITWLGEQGITDYKMEGAGTILVPADRVTNIKARLIQEQESHAQSPWPRHF